MARPRRQTILSNLEARDLIGRASEMERLAEYARSASGRGLTLLSAPGIGVSELLKQTFDRLFLDQKQIVPFYFAFRASDINPAHAAERFVYEFVLQTVAFRRQDEAIIESSPGLGELAGLSAPADSRWIERLVEAIDNRFETASRPFVRDCLAAPGRAAAEGTLVVALLDDVHNARQLGPQFFEELKEVFARARVPYVFAARRRFDFGQIDARRMVLEPLSFADAGRMIETTAERLRVEVSEQTRDLAAVQLDSNAQFITAVLHDAAAKSSALDSFQDFQQVYADSVFGGGIGRRLDGILEASVPAAAEEAVLDVLHDTAVLRETGVTVDAWRRVLQKYSAAASLELLNIHEIVRITSNRVELPPDNFALFDYVTARHGLEIEGEARALFYGKSLASFIVRAPQLMHDFYRRTAAVGVRGVLAAFDGRSVPEAFIDYGKFRDELKGMPDDEVLAAVGSSVARMVLPKMFYVTDAATIDREQNIAFEPERVAVGQGMSNQPGGTKEAVVWLAAEIDSKLEASPELAASWCDRLSELASSSDFENFRIWLVAPEGFTPEALEVLAERKAFGSSRKQLELLREQLGAAAAGAGENEYEIVLPMGEDAELIAAGAVEEIARRYNFSAKAINQIKTALVEACINAAEHSLSPDRKIYQKFFADGEKLTITISNRGLRLADKQPVEAEPTEGRRGWGLQLMRRLMDEVTIEDVDDGTRISMTKYLAPPETARPAG